MQIISRLLAIILVPLAGLGALWASSDHLSRQGIDWEVEIAGYDPRDLLRGHYVEFTYDWPIVEEDTPGDEEPWERARRIGRIDQLCLTGSAPVITEATVAEYVDANACEHPVIANTGGVYGRRSLTRGRLYVGQDRAKEIERELRNRDQRGIVTIRVREDGVMTPQGIRFRPLTPEELEERDADDDTRGSAVGEVVSVAVEPVGEPISDPDAEESADDR